MVNKCCCLQWISSLLMILWSRWLLWVRICSTCVILAKLLSKLFAPYCTKAKNSRWWEILCPCCGDVNLVFVSSFSADADLICSEVANSGWFKLIYIKKYFLPWHLWFSLLHWFVLVSSFQLISAVIRLLPSNITVSDQSLFVGDMEMKI